MAYVSIRQMPYDAAPYNAADTIYASRQFKDTYLNLKSDRHSVIADKDIGSARRWFINP